MIFALSASAASAVPPPMHPGSIGEPLKPAPYVPRAPSHRLPPAAIRIRGAIINVTFAKGKLAVPAARVMLWITSAVRAVTDYYGRFPVNHVNIRIVPVRGRKGVLYGHTWADHDVFTDVYVGQYTQPSELDNDWVMTHEMVHYAFPSVGHDHHWIEEGLATYVEPISRLEAGDLNAAAVWSELVEGLPNGLPRTGDRGLDHTHTWGRTYWGGAMFCLLADIRIHQQTHNRRGLRDALRAIVAHGGNIEAQWPIERALNTGDRAVGVPVLARLYNQMKSQPASPDLTRLWRELGVESEGNLVTFNDNAAMAGIRRAIASNPGPQSVARGSSPVSRDMSVLP
ncbi:MAG: hypothetical protein ACREQE_00955, partial [Candidatus Binataceae bacterium]